MKAYSSGSCVKMLKAVGNLSLVKNEFKIHN